MKKKFYLKAFLMLSISVSILSSCEKDVILPIQKENDNGQLQSSTIVKEFELKESWFPQNNFKSTSINGDIYANFGVGFDVITNSEKLTIFNPGVSLSPIISTTLAESTSLLYTYTSDYSQIDQKMTSALSAALNVSTDWVKANANVSVSNSTSISSSSNSVYVSVLYIKRYGKGNLVYTAPTINNYLTYKTNLTDNSTNRGPDGINLSSNQFRNIYGDKFKSALTFGVMLVGTIQITNVDFANSSKEDVAAQASASVQNMISANATWESQKSSNSHFTKSGIVVSCTAIPRTSAFVSSIAGLTAQVAYMDQCYASNDLGIIAQELTKFSNLYPTYQFINVDKQEFYANSCPMYLHFTSYPNTHKVYFELISTSSTNSSSERLLGRWFNSNWDNTKLKPLYLKPIFYDNNKLENVYITDSFYPSSNLWGLKGFVFKEKYYEDLVPLYMAEGKYYKLHAYLTNSEFGTSYKSPVLLGWIFPY